MLQRQLQSPRSRASSTVGIRFPAVLSRGSVFYEVSIKAEFHRTCVEAVRNTHKVFSVRHYAYYTD